MTRHLYQRTRGFTLVELLVVITIIAILAGLLTVTIGGVMGTANEFTVKMEMRQMEASLDKFQTQYGFFPPSFKGIVDPTANDPTDDADVIATANRLLPYINRIAPNHSETAIHPVIGGDWRFIDQWVRETGMFINWSTGDDLVFWLSGLNKNKQFPLTGGLNGGYVAYNGQDANAQIIEREVFFEFQASQLVFNPTAGAQEYNNDGASRTAGYRQGVGNSVSGLAYQPVTNPVTVPVFNAAPYLYLDAPNYLPLQPLNPMSNDGAYVNPRYTNLDGDNVPNQNDPFDAEDIDQLANPNDYGLTRAQANSLFERIYVNPKSFQLITFGIDGVAKTVYEASDSRFTPPNPNKWSDVGPDGTDNIVNFAGDGPNTLETLLLGTN